MEMIRKILADRSTRLSGEELRAVYRELREAGWHANLSRPEERGGKTFHPWWTNPVTGEDVRGIGRIMALAAGQTKPQPQPSEQALRVVEALAKKPNLAEEVRQLLNKAR